MQHKVVSQDEWIAARKTHLANEKAFTKARDRLSAERRALPWVKVEKNYLFDTPEGKKSLADLFDGGANSSSITSCLALIGAKVARAAPTSPIISTVRLCILPIAT